MTRGVVIIDTHIALQGEHGTRVRRQALRRVTATRTRRHGLGSGAAGASADESR
jgi:hypothetical protein